MRCGWVHRARKVAAGLFAAALLGSGTPPAHALPEPPPDPGLTCPDIEGFGGAYEPIASYSGREGLVFIFASPGRFSGLSTAECSYSEPADENSPVDFATIEVYWASPIANEQDRSRPCLLANTERDGVGVITLGGTTSAYATYAVSAQEPVDTAPFAAAARALLDQVVPLASSCDGVVTPPPTPTGLPGYLSGAFAADVLAGDGAAAVPPEAGTTVVETPGSEAAPAEASPTAATEASGVVRLLGALATVASLGLLAVTFVLVRRETRVRPAVDIARVVVIAAVGVAGTALLAEATSATAVVIAIVLGFALGAWQGSKLVVHAVGEGWTAKRTGWSVLAFAIGIVVTQLAARLDQVAGITLGLATTFLASALAAGVIVGRRSRLIDARRAAGVATLLLFALAAAMVPTDAATTRADDGDPETLLADERGAAQSALIGLVDWSAVEIRGGLFAGEAKPPISVGVPPALDVAPSPVSSTTTWSRDVGAGPVTFGVEETYTFGLRPDGLCCTVDYTGTGTRAEPSGAMSSYEAVGRLDDIQSITVEGSWTTSVDPDLLGVPFGEVRSYLPDGVTGDQPATADPTTCARPVAETRSRSDLEETGGAAALTSYRVDGVDRPPPSDFGQLALTTGCDVAGFTPADALAVAPPAPPMNDPARGAGCPVLQEALGALVPANSFGGVDTATTTRAFLEPNSSACSDLLRFGQGGPGETRHELMYQLAQPTDPAFGEYSSQVDEIYWTDLPLASDFSPDLTCAVDETGLPIAPDDPLIGCKHVNRYELDGVRVFVLTDWQTSDGPNVIVFVTAPWGSYSYRCHHCTPNDPDIGAFLSAVNSFAVDSAAQIAEATEAVGDTGATGTTGAVETTPVDPDGTVDPDPDPSTSDGTTTDEATSSSDRSEPTAIAALIGLGGAAAMLGLTLGELGGWRASDPVGAGAGGAEAGGSTAGDALGFLNNLQSFDGARNEYQALGYDPPIASTLAALEVLGGNAAGDAAPFGGIADNRLDQLSEAFLPQGVRSALVPSEVVKNDIRTALQAYDALTNSIGDSWYSGQLDLGAFDEFGAAIDARPGADPFAGYSAAMGLLFDELYTDGGVGLVQDLANIYAGASGVHGLPEDPSRVTTDDLIEAFSESADEFRDDVAGGKHGVVLQGLDEVFGITAEVVTDPVEAVGGFVEDLADIVEHGVGDGYWSEVGEQVHSTLSETPVIKVIYTGYHELFSGVLSQAESADDVVTGAAQAGFAAEMAEGAAALGAEIVDAVNGGDNAVRAFDYIRSWF